MNEKHKIPKRDNFFKSIYSKIAKILTPFFLNFTPNQVTLISGILGVTGALLLISNNYLILVIAAILIQLYAILDLVDGNIARERNLQSKFGMWLDIFFDKIIDFLIIFIMCLSVYLKNNNENILILGIFLMGVVFFNQFIMLLNDTYFSSYRNNKSELINRKEKKKILNLIIILIKFYLKHLSLYHITFLFLVSLFVIFDQMTFGIYFLTAHGTLSIILLIVVNFIKFYKRFS